MQYELPTRQLDKGNFPKLPGWTGLPLIMAIAVQGLPLKPGSLESRPFYVEDISAITQESIATIGPSNSILPTLVWGAMYAISILTLLRPRTRKDAVRLIYLQWPIYALLLLIALSAVWSPNTGKVAMNLIHGLGTLAICVTGAARYTNDISKFFRHACVALTLNMLAQIGAVILIPSIGIDFEGRWTGMTGQPNILGSMALVLFWLCCAGIKSLKNRRRPLWFGIALSSIILLGTNSVTSILCSVVAIFVLFIFPKLGINRLSGLSQIAIIGSLLAFVASLATLLGIQETLTQLSSYGNRSANFSGRSDIWLAAIELIQQKPILGWGFDDHASVILTTGMPHTSYHNGYLDLAVRGGLCAEVIFFSLAALIFRDIKTLNGKPLSLFFASFVAVTLVYNISEVTLFSHRNIIWIIFLFMSFCILNMRIQIKKHSIR